MDAFRPPPQRPGPVMAQSSWEGEGYPLQESFKTFLPPSVVLEDKFSLEDLISASWLILRQE